MILRSPSIVRIQHYRIIKWEWRWNQGFHAHFPKERRIDFNLLLGIFLVNNRPERADGKEVGPALKKRKLSDNYTFFARYDDATETDQEGSYTIYGIERNMAKGVTMALNMQSWTDAAEGSEAEQTLFLNLEYTF